MSKLVNSYYYPKGKTEYMRSPYSDAEKWRIIDEIAARIANGMKVTSAADGLGITMNTYYHWIRTFKKKDDKRL